MNTSILFSEEKIQEKIKELAEQINSTYGKSDIVAVGILNGAFVFYTDLIRRLKQNIFCDFCSVSFYGPAIKASSEPKLELDVQTPVKGKQVLLVDCIADQGHSLSFVKSMMERRQAKSVRLVSLIYKKAALQKIQIDFKGFEVSKDVFVVGYGLDYNQKGRNLKHISQLNDLN